MDVLQAVVLGLLQGVGEFLPISSSAHLIVMPWLMKWGYSGLSFEIALSFGTLAAVGIYFWKDWLHLLHKGFLAPGEREGKLFWYLVLATIPGAFIGFMMDDFAETVFRNPLLIACMLILLGVVLYAADGVGKKQIDLQHVTLKTSFLIGLSQALAIIPGVSRAGITISLALWLGMTREGAVRISFLLSAPILLGQALIKAPKLIANPVIMDAGFFVGMAAAAVFGLAAIFFLLRFIRSNTFLPFVIYRVALGILVLGFVFYRWDALRLSPVLAFF